MIGLGSRVVNRQPFCPNSASSLFRPRRLREQTVGFFFSLSAVLQTDLTWHAIGLGLVTW